MQPYERLTETSIDQFGAFIKFLADENLIDKAVEHLKNKGLDKIIVSVEHVLEVQSMMKAHFTTPDARAQAVILSSHNNSNC